MTAADKWCAGVFQFGPPGEPRVAPLDSQLAPFFDPGHAILVPDLDFGLGCRGPLALLRGLRLHGR